MDQRTNRVLVLLNPGASRAPEPEVLAALLAERPGWAQVVLEEGDSLAQHVRNAAATEPWRAWRGRSPSSAPKGPRSA